MITKIGYNGKIIIKQYGREPGVWYASEFTAAELVTERDILHTKIQYGRKVNPTVEEMKEIEKTEKLINKITVLIDQKFDENGKEVKP